MQPRRTILCRCRSGRKHEQVLLVGLILLNLLVTGLECEAAQREGLWVRSAATGVQLTSKHRELGCKQSGAGTV